jgi:hypothetical protein
MSLAAVSAPTPDHLAQLPGKRRDLGGEVTFQLVDPPGQLPHRCHQLHRDLCAHPLQPSELAGEAIQHP